MSRGNTHSPGKKKGLEAERTAAEGSDPLVFLRYSGSSGPPDDPEASMVLIISESLTELQSSITFTCEDVEASERLTKEARPQRHVVGLRQQVSREPVSDRKQQGSRKTH